ncbi:hypothetical protein GQ600_16973 [Phytophthora cactorum]|nr:hypothetical protein GQ600_16973 [Phytophthora cactorum]
MKVLERIRLSSTALHHCGASMQSEGSSRVYPLCPSVNRRRWTRSGVQPCCQNQAPLSRSGKRYWTIKNDELEEVTHWDVE